MDAISEVDPKLDDVLLFNDFLLTLTKAGVPIDLDGTGTTEDLLVRISKINSCFAMGIAKGKSVRTVMTSSDELPFQYRTALSTWLYCDRSPEAFNALTDSGSGRRSIERAIGFSMVQPFVLAILVYIGCILMLVYLGPKIESLSNQFGTTPGFALRYLNFARESMWVWVIAVPLFMVLIMLIWRQNRSRWNFFSIPGRVGIVDSISKASYADSLANLIEQNYSDQEARQAFGPLKSTLTKTPPLLQWALGAEVPSCNRVNALHATAQFYRNLAKTRSKRLGVWLAVVLGAVLGGGLVLFFGLSLFAPLIELLYSITQPKS